MTNKKSKKGSLGKNGAKKDILERIRLNPGGVDIGSERIFVSTMSKPVCSFNTFTQGIKESLDYLISEGVDSVVMEATGIYWWPIYEKYKEGGLEVYVVNACHSKNVPGRKTDVLDSEWLRELHTYGLLRSSFIPEAEICKLRVFMRSRQDHIEMAASHVQHMQKHMDAMNIKIHNVISNITGKTGLKIIEAILAGERDPEKLVTFCDTRISPEKIPDIKLSLEGHYKDEHLFGLGQAYDIWKYYQSKKKECDEKIELYLKELIKNKPVPENIKKPKPISNPNKLHIEGLHTMLITYTGGRDASQLPGFNDYSLMKIISELGTDMAPWPTEKHFTSWLNLAPWQNSSGKKKGTRRRKIQNRTGQMFRDMVRSVGKSKYQALGGFYRRIKSRSGAYVANKATARKIAVLYYRLMKYGFEYVEQGLEEYEKKYKEKMMRSLTKKAKELGMELIPKAA
jgi:transposase